MELGTFVDYCVEWNEAQGIDETKNEETKVVKREATQNDWDALLG